MSMDLTGDTKDDKKFTIKAGETKGATVDLQQSISSLTDVIKQLEEELKELKDERSTLKEKLKAPDIKNDQRNEIEARIDKLDANINPIRQQIAAKENLRAELEKQKGASITIFNRQSGRGLKRPLDEEVLSTQPSAGQLMVAAVYWDQKGDADTAETCKQLAKRRKLEEDDDVSGVVSPDKHLSDIAYVQNTQLWDDLAKKPDAKRELVEPDSFLQPERKLVAELRWLNACALAAQFDLGELKEKRAEKNDYEPCYHDGLLFFFERAADGQVGLRFLAENRKQTDANREDVRTQVAVNGKDLRGDPVEAKAEVAYGATDKESIDANADGLGKIVRVSRAHREVEGHVRLFVLAERFHRVFIGRLTLDDHHVNIREVLITPRFPKSKQDIDARSLLCALKPMDELKEPKLVDLMTSEVPDAFRLLVRWVDSVAALRGVPVSPLKITECQTGKELKSDDLGPVLRATKRSLVVQCGNDVLKVSASERVTAEARIHRIVDGQPQVRKMLAEFDVTGCGNLKAVLLEGHCRAIDAKTDAGDEASRTKLLQQARVGLDAMHKIGALHRDLKPNNMLIDTKTGQLRVNDFDQSRLHADDTKHDRHMGTPGFSAPFRKPEETQYTAQHDLRSLALTFLWLACGVTKRKRKDKLQLLEDLAAGKFASCKDKALQQLASESLGKRGST